jgi:tRNA uridine 5-carboxymethylaminomethyl modification enzyme
VSGERTLYSSEHRLVLREDNTLERLAAHAERLGLVSSAVSDRYKALLERKSSLLNQLRGTKLVPNEATQSKLRNLGQAVLQKPCTAEDLLKRPEINCKDLITFGIALTEGDEEIVEVVEIEVKYSGYIQRQLDVIVQSQRLENLPLPADLIYGRIRGLSMEEIEKLTKIQPRTLGQAQRISGVNPSAVQAIMVYLKAIGSTALERRQ